MQAAQSVSDSDLKITPAHLDNSAPVGSTIGSCSPGSDLRNSLHAMSSSRRDEPPLNSHQPCMIFSSSCTASDPERGFAGAGWSPRCYACSFCGREFNSAQALGGHMNIHRRDRARLRTSTSPTSAPHQADLPPIPQNTPQYSAGSSLYHPFEAAPFTKNPTAISSSLSAYTAPTIISASPAFRLLEMHSAADPTLLTLVAHPSQAENPAPSLSARSLLDLSPFCSNRSSANRFRKAQSESQTSFPDIAPHASPLLLRPSLENSSLKHVDALNTRARQASSWQVSLDHCSAAKAAGGAQVIQLGKRPRVDAQDAAIISSDEARSRVERCDDRSSTSISSTSEKSIPLDAAAEAPRTCVQPPSNIKGVLCLDLELRLGRSSASDSRASTAGGCSVRKTAPRQSEKILR